MIAMKMKPLISFLKNAVHNYNYLYEDKNCVSPPDIPTANQTSLNSNCSNLSIGESCEVDCFNGTLSGNNPVCLETAEYSKPYPKCGT